MGTYISVCMAFSLKTLYIIICIGIHKMYYWKQHGMGKVQGSTPLYKIIERLYKKALHILQYFPLFVVMGVKGNGKVFEEWQRPPAPGDYLGEVFSCHLFLLFMNEPCTPCNHRKVLLSSLPRYYHKCYKLPHYLLVYLWDCTHWLKNDSLSVFHRAQLMEFSLFPRP